MSKPKGKKKSLDYVNKYYDDRDEDMTKYDITFNERNPRPKPSLSTQTTTNILNNGDHVYLNIVMNNQTMNDLQIQYNETRLSPLINKPSDYYLTVARFNIPMNGVPIFNYNDSSSVTLTYHDPGSGNDYTSNQIFLIYISSYSDPTNPKAIAQSVGSYQQFVDSINNALQTAFTTLNAAVIAGGDVLPISNAPYMIYNSTTLLLSLIGQTGFAANNLKLYFDNSLFDFFENFQFISSGSLPEFNLLSGISTGTPNLTSAGLFNPSLVGYSVIGPGIPVNTYISAYVNPSLLTMSQNATLTTSEVVNFSLGTEIQILIKNNFNNSITDVNGQAAYEMRQEYVSLYNWNFLSSIQFLSNNIPVRGEFVPNLVVGQSSQINPSSLSSDQILTDFVINTITGPDLFSNTIYNPQGPYRLIDLVSDFPLTIIDLRAVFKDSDNVSHPLLIQPGESASIKLLFIKKDAINRYSFF